MANFNDYEVSSDAGLPGRAYRFTLGDAVWRYVTGPRDMIIQGHKWKAVPISDSGVKLTGDAVVDALTITAPDSIGPARLFIGTPPSGDVGVTIFVFHFDIPDDMSVEYEGDITQIDRPQPGTASITCESLYASMDRDGLRYGWQRACGYALYDQRSCRVNKADFAVEAVIENTTLDGLVTASAFGSKEDGWFIGGFLEWTHPVRGVEFRAIEEHTGSIIKMFGAADGLYPGLPVKAYPGCNRTSDHCINRFNNLVNYPGFIDLDGKSPFDGTPVF